MSRLLTTRPHLKGRKEMIMVENNPMFTIKVDPDNNKMLCWVSGVFSAVEAGESIVGYNKGVALVTPAETDLVIDCNDLVIANKNVLYLLKSCFQMYINTGFKSITLVISKEKTARFQMQLLVDELEADFNFVEEYIY